jgi:type I restriction enzyme R subunit
MSGHTERDFETAIEAGLTGVGGYATRAATAYDEALALFPEDVTGFLKDSQPTRWGQLEALLGREDRSDRARQPDQGARPQGHAPCPAPWVQMLRQDVPHGLLPPELGDESRSRRAIRQEPADHHASGRLHLGAEACPTANRHRRCIIDVTLGLNGLPVSTAELKNPMTGQRAADAMRQYARNGTNAICCSPSRSARLCISRWIRTRCG